MTNPTHDRSKSRQIQLLSNPPHGRSKSCQIQLMPDPTHVRSNPCQIQLLLNLVCTKFNIPVRPLIRLAPYKVQDSSVIIHSYHVRTTSNIRIPVFVVANISQLHIGPLINIVTDHLQVLQRIMFKLCRGSCTGLAEDNVLALQRIVYKPFKGSCTSFTYMACHSCKIVKLSFVPFWIPLDLSFKLKYLQ